LSKYNKGHRQGGTKGSSRQNGLSKDNKGGIEIITMGRVEEVYKFLF
jgi:hypothetical protein